MVSSAGGVGTSKMPEVGREAPLGARWGAQANDGSRGNIHGLSRAIGGEPPGAGSPRSWPLLWLLRGPRL